MVKSNRRDRLLSKTYKKPYASPSPSANIREPETLTRHDALFHPTRPQWTHINEHRDHNEVEDRRTKKGDEEARQKEREKYKEFKGGKSGWCQKSLEERGKVGMCVSNSWLEWKQLYNDSKKPKFQSSKRTGAGEDCVIIQNMVR